MSFFQSVDSVEDKYLFQRPNFFSQQSAKWLKEGRAKRPNLINKRLKKVGKILKT